MYFGRFSGIRRLDLKTCQSNYLLIDKVKALPQRGLKCCFWREIKRKLSVPPLHSLFWTPKAKTKGSKERHERSNGNLNGESAKETMLSEKRISG